MVVWQIITIVMVSFIASWSCNRILLRLTRMSLLDIPNERSSHKVPTPTGGGVGIFTGFTAGSVVAFLIGIPTISLWLFAAIVLITILGFVDDISKGLNVSLRFIIQIIAACLVVLPTGGLERFPLPPPFDILLLPFVGKVISIVWVVGVTNIYNFLDGIDGYAGSQGLIASVAIAFAGIGGIDVVAISLAMAGACLGFLLLNWHPAKMFMGDSGSNLIGFTLASLPFFCSLGQPNEALYFIVIVLWFFLSDGAYTIFRRLVRGEKVWVAHRSHLYQRLVKSGLRHDQVTLYVCLAVTILILILMAFKVYGRNYFTWWIMLFAIVFFITYLVYTELHERKMQRNNTKSLSKQQ